MSWNYQPLLPSTAVLANIPPTVALNSPADEATGVSTTPTLEFTGTDSNSDSVRYNIQVDTVDTFDSQGGGATVVQKKSGNSGSYTNTCALTWNSNTTTGNTIIVSITYNDDTAGTISSVTDSQSNTYNLIGTGGSSGGDTHTASYYAYNITGGTTPTVTVTMSTGDHDFSMTMREVSGLTTTDPLDKVAEGTTASGTSHTSATTATTTQANELVYATIGLATTATFTLGSGYSELSETTGSDIYQASASETKRVTSIGTQTATFTSSASAVSYFIIATFKEAGGPLIDAVSGTDAGFSNTTDGGDTDPFDSGDKADYDVQVADTLDASTEYFWRVRAIDPSGSNSYGDWSATRSFTTGGGSSQETKTFTVDGYVALQTTKTFTTDGIVKVVDNTKTFTADGYVAQNTTFAFVETYYFDLSDANYSDPNLNWSQEVNAFDGDTGTVASMGMSSTTSNRFLYGQGTNAPETGGTVTQVRARLYGNPGDVGPTIGSIYTDGLGELLGEPERSTAGNGWGDYVTLSTPTGGWTWYKLAHLEVKLHGTDNLGGVTANVAKIELEITSNLSVDGVVQGTQTTTFTVDGLVQVTQDSTFTVDGIVAQTATSTFTVDGIVQATLTNTFTVDGIVEGIQTTTFTADGVIEATQTNTFTIDGVVVGIQTSTFTVDGIVNGLQTATITTDGIVQATQTSTFTTDGLVKDTLTSTFTVDGLILEQKTATFTIDGIVQATLTKTFTIDGIVQGILTNTFTVDGYVSLRTTNTFTIDGIVGQKNNISTFTIDGLVKDIFTKTFTVDGIIQGTQTNTFTADGIIQGVQTTTFTIDGVVNSGDTHTFTVDGIVQGTQTSTFTIDGLVKSTLTNTFTVDGLVKDTFTNTFTIDGIVLSQQTNTFTVDGVVLATSLNQFTTDALVKDTFTNNFTIDGLIYTTSTQNITVDGLVVLQTTKTFTVDGFVASQTTNTFTIDGLVLVQQSSQFTVDGVVVPQMGETKFEYLTLDGIVFGTGYISITTDGEIRQDKQHSVEAPLTGQISNGISERGSDYGISVGIRGGMWD